MVKLHGVILISAFTKRNGPRSQPDPATSSRDGEFRPKFRDLDGIDEGLGICTCAQR